eukprot:TRINITY_DN1390_c1_g1_i1.p1 TRINITY_DN1390_c1_g1~~TRINITY_DN1390_c1_g1_i1.p1  ORF type:complete len:374 (-),score=53.75 TRINITY_DN1390_c1_g1_i1:489-1610(-)
MTECVHLWCMCGLQLIEVVGKTMVLFRGVDDKTVKLLDAYCPHLGANMGAGGVVVGDHLQCPFHQWQFDGDGKCQTIPYTDNIPSSAVAKSYEVMELYGAICFWYDVEGRPAHWKPHLIPQLESGNYIYRGSYKSRNVHMHIQDYAENSADLQHIAPMHGQMLIPFTQIPVPFIQIVHVAGWTTAAKRKAESEKGKREISVEENTLVTTDNHTEKDGAERVEEEGGISGTPHIAYFADTAHLAFRGQPIPRTAAVAEVTFVGAAIYYFHFHTDIGDVMLIQTNTPAKPLEQQVEFFWWSEKSMPWVIATYVVGNWIAQWKNDIEVWENKTWLTKPLLVKNDGPIMPLRRWFAQQFYSDNSLSCAAANTQSLAW